MNKHLVNSVPTVLQVSTHYNPKFEKWTISVDEPGSKFKFRFKSTAKKPNSNDLVYKQDTAAKTLADWTNEAVRVAFNSAAQDHNAKVTSVDTVDGSNKLTNRAYTIEFQKYRDQSNNWVDI